MATAAPVPAARRRLNVVKIYLSLATCTSPGGGAEVSSTSVRGDNQVLFDITFDGQPQGLLQATVDEIRLPLTLAQARSFQSSDANYQLPSHISAALDNVIPHDGTPLWLSFPLPSGYLPIVPWEQLLEPRLQVPILRLSYTQVQPIVSSQTLDIIVCFSFPVAKQVMAPEAIINYYFDHIPANIARCTTFHVFADVAVQPLLQQVRARKPECNLQIYSPEQARQYEVPEANPTPSASSAELDSPWLLWIRDAMGSTSADLVHFFCHGYLAREDGFLCFSQSPLRNDDEFLARFVGARQICTFLDQVGAWSAAFSSQPGNYSIAGLRLLHDQMARIRPGPVLYHDMYSDPQADGLVQAYQYAYAIEEAYPPKSPSISLCCHPDWAMPVSSPADPSEILLGELTLAGRIPQVFQSQQNTPSWLASGQRSLERSVAQLISTEPAGTEDVLESGTAEALRFTADLLRKHAKTFGFGD